MAGLQTQYTINYNVDHRCRERAAPQLHCV
jgi:hypothetical protein